MTAIFRPEGLLFRATEHAGGPWSPEMLQGSATTALMTREVETFLPTVERWSRWKDRRKKITFPLFPGYCFARFSLVDRLRVLNVAGVADLIGDGGRPEPVPESEIDHGDDL